MPCTNMFDYDDLVNDDELSPGLLRLKKYVEANGNRDILMPLKVIEARVLTSTEIALERFVLDDLGTNVLPWTVIKDDFNEDIDKDNDNREIPKPHVNEDALQQLFLIGWIEMQLWIYGGCATQWLPNIPYARPNPPEFILGLDMEVGYSKRMYERFQSSWFAPAPNHSHFPRPVLEWNGRTRCKVLVPTEVLFYYFGHIPAKTKWYNEGGIGDMAPILFFQRNGSRKAALCNSISWFAYIAANTIFDEPDREGDYSYMIKNTLIDAGNKAYKHIGIRDYIPDNIKKLLIDIQEGGLDILSDENKALLKKAAEELDSSYGNLYFVIRQCQMRYRWKTLKKSKEVLKYFEEKESPSVLDLALNLTTDLKKKLEAVFDKISQFDVQHILETAILPFPMAIETLRAGVPGEKDDRLPITNVSAEVTPIEREQIEKDNVQAAKSPADMTSREKNDTYGLYDTIDFELPQENYDSYIIIFQESENGIDIAYPLSKYDTIFIPKRHTRVVHTPALGKEGNYNYRIIRTQKPLITMEDLKHFTDITKRISIIKQVITNIEHLDSSKVCHATLKLYISEIPSLKDSISVTNSITQSSTPVYKVVIPAHIKYVTAISKRINKGDAVIIWDNQKLPNSSSNSLNSDAGSMYDIPLVFDSKDIGENILYFILSIKPLYISEEENEITNERFEDILDEVDVYSGDLIRRIKVTVL